MKYCVKCENELVDEAVICTKCGCAVDESYYSIYNRGKAPFKNESLVEDSDSKISQTLEILNFIFSILLIVSFFLINLSIIFAHIYNGLRIRYNYYNDPYIYGRLDFYLGWSTIQASMIVSIVAFVGFFVYSILFFTKKKNKSLNAIFNTILKLFLSAVFMVISIVAYA